MCLNLSPLIILSNIDDDSILAADMLGVDYAFNFSSELLLPTEFDLPLDNEFFFLNNIESAKQCLLSTSGNKKCVQSVFSSNYSKA